MKSQSYLKLFIITVAVITVAILIFGGDRISGVETYVELEAKPNIQCVNQVITNVSKFGNVEFRDSQEVSKQLLPRFEDITTYSYVWIFKNTDSGIVQIHGQVGSEENWSYSNGKTKMGEPYLESELDAYIPLMNEINTTIEESCGLPIKSKGKLIRN